MIKVQRAGKVKERLTLNSLRQFLLPLAASLACFFVAAPCFAQSSEKDVQTLEAQEFGIEGGKTKKPKADHAEKPAARPEDYQQGAEPERVSPIEAEEFRVRLKKKSRSGRVLLFEDSAESRPRPGRILLIKDGNSEIAAVRVLKNYPGRFAGKVVLPFTEPQTDAEYRALKKLGEKIITMIKEREKRGKDLDAARSDEDLAKEVAPDDNELDRGIPAPKPKTKGKPEGQPAGESGPKPLFTREGTEIDAENIEISDEEEALADLSVQEDLPLEPYRHAVSLEFGQLNNVDKSNAPTSYSALGFRYAFNFWRAALFRKKSFQDMFTLELGLFYYVINDFLTTGDSVTVYPLVGTFRYTFLIGENLGLFLYAGFMKNNVGQSSGGISSNTAILTKSVSALGAGVTLKIGPAWAARLDFGTDLFGIGAVLKF